MIHKFTEENPPLTLDECKEIFAQIRECEKHDDKSSQLKYEGLVAKVILSVEGMVKTIAEKYAKSNNADKPNKTKQNDYESFGREGAFKALQNYDPFNYETKYSSYAQKYIEAEIKKQIRVASRMGYKKVKNWKIYLDMANHIANISYAFTCRKKRLPTYEELAGIMKISPSTLIACIKMVDSHVESIHTPLSDDGDEELESLLPSDKPTPFEEAKKQDVTDKLQKVYQNLSSRELNTISMRFGLSDGYKISFSNSVTTYKIPNKKLEAIKKDLLENADGDSVFSIEGFFEMNRAVCSKPSDEQKKALGIFNQNN
jgi:DNA-directed RNA polymerase specialized sigma subunit